MDLRQLSYIIVISEELNLTKAAERLFISQSALSLFLSKLETELDVTLFTRSKNRLSITPEGQLYVETARRILELKDDLYQKIQVTKKQISIHIGIACQTVSELFSKTCLHFQSHFPDVQISVSEGRSPMIMDKLYSGMLDLCITGGTEPLQHRLFDTEIIKRDELCILLPPTHRLASLASQNYDNPPIADMRLFSGERFALSARNTLEYQLSQDLFRDYKIDTHIICERSNRYNLCQMVMNNFCLAILPQYGIPRNMGLLICKPDRPYYRYMQVFVKKGKSIPKEVFIFKDMLIDSYLHFYDQD